MTDKNILEVPYLRVLTYGQAVLNAARGGHVYALYLDEFEKIKDLYYMQINELRDMNDSKKDNVIYFEVLRSIPDFK